MIKKYCMDCGHYIPGGRERNCNIAQAYYNGAVCALKEACDKFVEREDRSKEVFAPIKMREIRTKRRSY